MKEANVRVGARVRHATNKSWGYGRVKCIGDGGSCACHKRFPLVKWDEAAEGMHDGNGHCPKAGPPGVRRYYYMDNRELVKVSDSGLDDILFNDTEKLDLKLGRTYE
jgi:hypothetical protein